MSAASSGSVSGQEAEARSLADRLSEYRAHREELERGVLPLATSVDGRRFTLQASLHGLTLQAGGYVVIEGDGPACLGQILTLRPDSMSVPDFLSGGTSGHPGPGRAW